MRGRIVEGSERVTPARAREKDAELLAHMSKRVFHSDVDVGAPGKKRVPLGYDSPQFQVNLMSWCDYHEMLSPV